VVGELRKAIYHKPSGFDPLLPCLAVVEHRHG
jgi:hypothetical protein